MTTHIDTIEEWWKLAEDGIPQAGDTVIFDERHRGRGFHVTQATKDHPRGYDNARILARAPKPKPAWHDAVAVIAGLGGERQVFVPTVSGMWESKDFMLTPDEMANPVPLIEAKVTDAMVERAIDAWVADEQRGDGYLGDAIRSILTAALGLETE